MCILLALRRSLRLDHGQDSTVQGGVPFEAKVTLFRKLVRQEEKRQLYWS